MNKILSNSLEPVSQPPGKKIQSNKADSLFAENASQKESASVGVNDRPTRLLTMPVVKPGFSQPTLVLAKKSGFGSF